MTKSSFYSIPLKAWYWIISIMSTFRLAAIYKIACVKFYSFKQRCQSILYIRVVLLSTYTLHQRWYLLPSSWTLHESLRNDRESMTLLLSQVDWQTIGQTFVVGSGQVAYIPTPAQPCRCMRNRLIMNGLKRRASVQQLSQTCFIIITGVLWLCCLPWYVPLLL